MKTALTFAIMDAPFENSRTVTMFRIDRGSARTQDTTSMSSPTRARSRSPSRGRRRMQTPCTGATLRRRTIRCRACGSRRCSRSRAKQGRKLDWVNCGLCVDERGVAEAIEGVRRGSPADFWKMSRRVRQHAYRRHALKECTSENPASARDGLSRDGGGAGRHDRLAHARDEGRRRRVRTAADGQRRLLRVQGQRAPALTTRRVDAEPRRRSSPPTSPRSRPRASRSTQSRRTSRSADCWTRSCSTRSRWSRARSCRACSTNTRASGSGEEFSRHVRVQSHAMLCERARRHDGGSARRGRKARTIDVPSMGCPPPDHDPASVRRKRHWRARRAASFAGSSRHWSSAARRGNKRASGLCSRSARACRMR